MMACPCCNRAGCGNCLVPKTLYGTITTANGTPFKDTVFGTAGVAPLPSSKTELPDSFELVFNAPGTPYNPQPVTCGPQCVTETPVCGALASADLTTSQGEPVLVPFAQWRSTSQSCSSVLIPYDDFRAGRTYAPYVFACDYLQIVAHTRDMDYWLNSFGSVCQSLFFNNCRSIPVGSIAGGSVIVQLGLLRQSCSPFVATASFTAGGIGSGPFRGFFSEDFTVTITE